MSDGDAAEPDVSSADEGSHWPNVLLLLPEEEQLEAGQALIVRTRAELAGEQPRYEFELLLEGADGGAGDAGPGADVRALRSLGTVSYPE